MKNEIKKLHRRIDELKKQRDFHFYDNNDLQVEKIVEEIEELKDEIAELHEIEQYETDNNADSSN